MVWLERLHEKASRPRNDAGREGEKVGDRVAEKSRRGQEVHLIEQEL
jgi:hypothetical protein